MSRALTGCHLTINQFFLSWASCLPQCHLKRGPVLPESLFYLQECALYPLIPAAHKLEVPEIVPGMTLKEQWELVSFIVELGGRHLSIQCTIFILFWMIEICPNNMLDEMILWKTKHGKIFTLCCSGKVKITKQCGQWS